MQVKPGVTPSREEKLADKHADVEYDAIQAARNLIQTTLLRKRKILRHHFC